jgi:hypothetical protein
MTPAENYILAMVSIIPAAVGIYKYKRTDKKFYPLIYMIWLIVLIENIAYWLPRESAGLRPLTDFLVNIYAMANFGLFLYFVQVNHYISKKLALLLFVSGLAAGIGNAAIQHTAFIIFLYLLCFVSTVMLFISINIMSRQIMEVKTKLVNNTWFWISSIFILYNGYNLLIFGMYVLALANSPNGKTIGNIVHFVNAACYILYVVVLLRLPENKKRTV